MKRSKLFDRGYFVSAERKRGVALLFVLGLLAMVVSLAVSFAGLMRSERVLAGNTVEIVKTRQLALSALDIVVYDFANNNDWLGTNMYPTAPWTSDLATSTLASPGDMTNNALSGHFQVFDTGGGGSLLHFPEDLIDANGNLDNSFYTEDSPYYLLKDGNNDLVGRFSFVAIDQSGGIDINVAGPSDPRERYAEGERNTATNLYLKELSGLMASDRPGALEGALLVNDKYAPYLSLLDYRTRHNQHTIYSEKREYARWVPSRTINGRSVGFRSAGNWNVFSKYPQVWDDDNDPSTLPVERINLSEVNDVVRDAAGLTVAQKTEKYDALYDEWVNQGFKEAYQTSDQRNKGNFGALVDYVDEDYLPYSGLPFNQSFTRAPNHHSFFIPEPIPLFSQVVFTNTVTVDPAATAPSNLVLNSSVTLELWFPFSGLTNSHNYRIKINNSWTPEGGAVSAWFPDYSSATATPATPTWSNDRVNENSGDSTDAGWYIDGQDPDSCFAEVTFTATPGIPISQADIATINNGGSVPTLRFEVRDMDEGELIVNSQVGSMATNDFATTGGATTDKLWESDLSNQPLELSVRPSSPSYNWNVGAGGAWGAAYPEDLGSADKREASGGPPAWEDKVLPFFPVYIKNGPIENVAELLRLNVNAYNTMSSGFVMGDSRTLGDSAVGKVNLDAFTIMDTATYSNAVSSGRVPFKRGLINMNTLDAEALASAIYGETTNAPYLSSPEGGGSAVGILTWNQALDIADELIAQGPYVDKSDFAIELINILDDDDYGKVELVSGISSKGYRELILKNTLDMVDYTGNTILVGLHVEKLQDVNGNGNYDSATDLIVSSRDVVALLWRDPTTLKTEVLSIFWPELTL